MEEVRSQLVDKKGFVRDRVRRASQKGPIVTAWLSALPSCAAQSEIPDADFRLLLRWWLGLPILPTGVTLPECPLCRQSVDPFGDHLVCCEQNVCAVRHNTFAMRFLPCVSSIV